MNNIKTIMSYCALAALFTLLQACGGSSGGGAAIDGTGNPGGGGTANAKVTSIGAIAAENELVVNGVTYDANTAEITVDNEPGDIDQLALGQVVVITGTLDETDQTGIAETVSFNTDILGPVEQVDEVNKSLQILGQTIQLGEESLLLTSQGDGISLGDNLRVAGFALANGDLAATFVEKVTLTPDPGSDVNITYEVSGLIENLDIDAMTFTINDLVVDYSRTVTLETLENGMAVEVFGIDYSRLLNLDALGGSELALEILSNAFNEFDQFIAVILTPLSDPVVGAEELVELEGFVTFFRSPEDFEINETRIRVDDDTVYVGGIKDNLGLNKKIEIEGYVDADGVLVANRIVF